MMSNERICFKLFHKALVFINLQKKHLNLLQRFLNKQGSMSLFAISRGMPNYLCIYGTLDNQCVARRTYRYIDRILKEEYFCHVPTKN